MEYTSSNINSGHQLRTTRKNGANVGKRSRKPIPEHRKQLFQGKSLIRHLMLTVFEHGIQNGGQKAGKDAPRLWGTGGTARSVSTERIKISGLWGGWLHWSEVARSWKHATKNNPGGNMEAWIAICIFQNGKECRVQP